MTQYEDKFRELSRYTLKGARLEAELSHRFLRGLFQCYVETVVNYDLQTVRQMAKSTRGMKYVQLRGKRSREGSSSHQQAGVQS